MTETKFAALQTLAGELNVAGGISTSAYVQQIADNVIEGNSANAYWNGGSSTATALGDLTATSSQSQVDDLIGKWFLGTDLPFDRHDRCHRRQSSVTIRGHQFAAVQCQRSFLYRHQSGQCRRLLFRLRAGRNRDAGSLADREHDPGKRQRHLFRRIPRQRRPRLRDCQRRTSGHARAAISGTMAPPWNSTKQHTLVAADRESLCPAHGANRDHPGADTGQNGDSYADISGGEARGSLDYRTAIRYLLDHARRDMSVLASNAAIRSPAGTGSYRRHEWQPRIRQSRRRSPSR